MPKFQLWTFYTRSSLTGFGFIFYLYYSYESTNKSKIKDSVEQKSG